MQRLAEIVAGAPSACTPDVPLPISTIIVTMEISYSAFRRLYKIFAIGYDLIFRRLAHLESRDLSHPLPIGKFLTSMILVLTVAAMAVLTAAAAVAVLAVVIAPTMTTRIRALQ